MEACLKRFSKAVSMSDVSTMPHELGLFDGELLVGLDLDLLGLSRRPPGG